MEDEEFAFEEGKRKFNVERLTDFLRTPPPSWLVTDTIPASAVTQVYGEPGCLKSTVVADIAAHVAYGLKWHGRAVVQGHVLYIVAEGQAGFAKRLRVWHHARKIPPVDDAPIRILRTAFSPFVAGDVDAFVADVLATSPVPRLVVVDTMARSFAGGQENDNDDVGIFMVAIDQIRAAFTDATVILIHHCGWDGKHPRGGSVQQGALDAIIKVEKLKSATSDTPGTGKMIFEKQKDAEQGLPLNIVVTEHRNDIGEHALVLTSAVVGQAPGVAEARYARIRDFLGQDPKGKTYTQVFKAIGGNRKLLKEDLAAMEIMGMFETLDQVGKRGKKEKLFRLKVYY